MAATPNPRVPRALLVAFTACLLYACLASGASEPPEQSWLELALAVLATGAAAAWLYGNGLQLRASRVGLAGLAALGLFAAWAAASIAWSVTPDRSWAEANRVIAYVLTVVIGVFVGSSLPRAAERVGLAIGLASLPVALYALGGKTLPGLNIGDLFSLNHTEQSSRLRAPLGYWNALALCCVSGLLPLLRLSADPSRRPGRRVAALLAVFVLALVLGLTYSRGGVLALVAGVLTLVALGTERVRTLVLLASALVAAALPLSLALSRRDLTTDLVPLARRTDDGLLLLAAVLLVGGLLAVWGRVVIRLERSPSFTPERGRALGQPVAVALGLVLTGAVVVSVATGGAASGLDDFSDTDRSAAVTDPNRLLSSSSANRWEWWQEAAGAWSDKPVAGWGAGSFRVTHRLYRKVPLSVEQPHNVPLQWLAEDGLVGLLLAAGGLLALLAAALARVRSLPWAAAGAGPERGAAAALMAVAVAWCVHSLLEWSWDIPAVTLPMLVCLGVLAARPVRGGARRVTGRAGALVAVAAAFVLYAVSCALPAIAQTQTSSALATVSRDDVTDAELADAASRVELAARLNPLATDALLAASDIASRRRQFERARTDLLRAVRRQPYDVNAWSQLARLALETGDRAAVRRAATRALELDPINGRLYTIAAQAFSSLVLPAESASATGSPLPTEVPVTVP